MKDWVKAKVYSDPKRTEKWLSEVRTVATPMEPLTDVQLAHCAITQNCAIHDLCVMCGRKPEVQIYKGSGVCCELCRKDRDRDHGSSRALAP